MTLEDRDHIMVHYPCPGAGCDQGLRERADWFASNPTGRCPGCGEMIIVEPAVLARALAVAEAAAGMHEMRGGEMRGG